MIGSVFDGIAVAMRGWVEVLDHGPMQRQFGFVIVRWIDLEMVCALTGCCESDHMIMAQKAHTTMHETMMGMSVVALTVVCDDHVGIPHEIVYGVTRSIGIKTGMIQFDVTIIVNKAQE